MTRLVYNLEFPSWCQELAIFGYRFSRVEDYRDRVVRLQHLVTVHSEFTVQENTGEHAITARVETPEQEEDAILEWDEGNATAISDVLLLLSIFTQRDVFTVAEGDRQQESGVITSDPRRYQGGGILRTSIPFRGQPTGEEPYRYDIGFEEGLNQIYSLIRSDDWQRKYGRGYFLFLARMAFRRQPLEAAFVQCWTIWEHLFAVLNQSWLSEARIRSLSASEKIAYLLVTFALRAEVSNADRGRIEALAEIRNRLIHFGRFPDRGPVRDDAVLFLRLTEFIIARTLELSPSNVLNTLEGLENYFNNLPAARRA